MDKNNPNGYAVDAEKAGDSILPNSVFEFECVYKMNICTNT